MNIILITISVISIIGLYIICFWVWPYLDDKGICDTSTLKGQLIHSHIGLLFAILIVIICACFGLLMSFNDVQI